MKIIIAALSENHIIGSGAGMPWNVPEEYTQFLRFISGQTVIMGRKSFQIFGKDLMSKRNFILSHQPQPAGDALFFTTINEAIEEAEKFEEDIYIAGGATIYRQTIDLVDKMYLSFIKGQFEGDAFFPVINKKLWQVEKRENHPQYNFNIYCKK